MTRFGRFMATYFSTNAVTNAPSPFYGCSRATWHADRLPMLDGPDRPKNHPVLALSDQNRAVRGDAVEGPMIVCFPVQMNFCYTNHAGWV
jgi:hypothetical protein